MTAIRVASPHQGDRSICPCGTPVEYDEIDGWQHADGSVSHDGQLASKSVSDLMAESSIQSTDEPEFHRGVMVSVNPHELIEAHDQGGMSAVHRHLIDKVTRPEPTWDNPHPESAGLGTHWTSRLEVAQQFAHGQHYHEPNSQPQIKVNGWGTEMHVPVVMHGRIKPEHHVTHQDELRAAMVEGHGYQPLKARNESETLVRPGTPVHVTGIEASFPDHHGWLDRLADHIEIGDEESDPGKLPHSWQPIGGAGHHVAARFTPDKRVFTHTDGLDHRLFDGEHLRPEVRSYILGTITSWWADEYRDWSKWAKIFFAGSEASEWSSPTLEGNGDLDILVGVDYDGCRGANPQLAGLTDQQITDRMNAGFRAHNGPVTLTVDGIKYGPFDRTTFVNKDSWDISRIKPYSAYDVGADEWVVKPPHLPHWSLSELPKPVQQVLRAADSYARHVLKLPEPERTQQGAALFEAWHTDRSRAFSERGEGWWDIANLREKWGDQQGWWAQLVECAHRAKQGLDAAPADWSNTPYGAKQASYGDYLSGGGLDGMRERIYSQPQHHIGDEWQTDEYPGTVGWVRTDKMLPLRHHDGTENGRSPEVTHALTEGFQHGEGWLRPLHLNYSAEDHATWLAEGNHRLEAARRAGETHVPVTIGHVRGGDLPSEYRPAPFPQKVHSYSELKALRGRSGDTIHPAHILPADWLDGGSRKTAKLPKTQKCDYCEQQATKRVIWAEGMAYTQVCDEHEQRAKDHVGDDYCNTRPIAKVASNPTMYHWAPQDARDDIAQHGLDHTRAPGFDPAKQGPHGVFLHHNEDLARDWVPDIERTHDLYAVDTHGLSLRPDPYDTGDASYTERPVPPDRLRRLARTPRPGDYWLSARTAAVTLDRNLPVRTDLALNHGSHYRMIGETGFHDFLNTGRIRAAQDTRKNYDAPYFNESHPLERYHDRRPEHDYVAEAHDPDLFERRDPGAYPTPTRELTAHDVTIHRIHNETGHSEVVHSPEQPHPTLQRAPREAGKRKDSRHGDEVRLPEVDHRSNPIQAVSMMEAPREGALPHSPGRLFYRVHPVKRGWSQDNASSQPFGGGGPHGDEGEELPREHGYSAFDNPHDLGRYLNAMDWHRNLPRLPRTEEDREEGRPGRIDPHQIRVVQFPGEIVGHGHDGEHLVHPHARADRQEMDYETFQHRLRQTPHPDVSYHWHKSPYEQVPEWAEGNGHDCDPGGQGSCHNDYSEEAHETGMQPTHHWASARSSVYTAASERWPMEIRHEELGKIVPGYRPEIYPEMHGTIFRLDQHYPLRRADPSPMGPQEYHDDLDEPDEDKLESWRSLQRTLKSAPHRVPPLVIKPNSGTEEDPDEVMDGNHRMNLTHDVGVTHHPAYLPKTGSAQLWITPQLVMGSAAGLNHARQVNSANEAVTAVQQGLTAVLPPGAWFPVRQVLLGLGMSLFDVTQRLKQFGAPSSVTG